MSLDLLKEFGSQNQNPEANYWVDNISQKAADNEGIDEDDFGDFEVPAGGTLPKKQGLPCPDAIEVTGVSDVGKLVDLSDGSDNPIGTPSIPQKNVANAKPQKSQLLFQRRTPVFERRTSPLFEKRTSPLFERRTSLFERRTEDQPTSRNAPHSEVQEADILSEKPSILEKLEDDWDNFVEHSVPLAVDELRPQEDMLHTHDLISKRQPTKQSTSLTELCVETTASLVNPANIGRNKSSSLAKGDYLGPPPSNIPPPSILLLLVLTIFQSLLANTKNVISLTEASTFPPDQSRVDQLQLCLSIVRAAARIIAGRKLRWKRDTHLSQSMKIGPAHSGKAGGMKLTGVDRTESLREDREVAEALSVWRKHLGGLRAAITMVNAELRKTVLFVPDISENMHVRVAKLEDGALTAPKSCFLCGLKRDERLDKVDVNVEDSFGEWWTDHWGHFDCRIFWERQESSLEQRR